MRHSYLKLYWSQKFIKSIYMDKLVKNMSELQLFLFKTFSIKEPIVVTNVLIKQHSPFHKVLQPKMNL